MFNEISIAISISMRYLHDRMMIGWCVQGKQIPAKESARGRLYGFLCIKDQTSLLCVFVSPNAVADQRLIIPIENH